MPLYLAEMFCSVLHLMFSLLLRPRVLLENKLSSPSRAQSSHRERSLILVAQEMLQVGAQLSFQEVKRPFYSGLPTETRLFGVPLKALLEADRKALPRTQVPLVLQAVSSPQIGLH